MNFKQKIALALASGMGFGYAPVASGTVGALWGIPLFVLFTRCSQKIFPGSSIAQWSFYMLLVGLLFVVGVRVSDIGEKHWGEKDPGKVVIDEIVGYLLTMFALPETWGWVIAGFLLCRILDIIKPWPARLADRKCPGGLGIMLDDAVSGIQGAVILNIVRAFFF